MVVVLCLILKFENSIGKCYAKIANHSISRVLKMVTLIGAAWTKTII